MRNYRSSPVCHYKSSECTYIHLTTLYVRKFIIYCCKVGDGAVCQQDTNIPESTHA